MKDLVFDKDGLIVVITQDVFTGEVLMQAYANKEAIKKSISTGYAHYYSRSRKKLWKKGEESGHVQKLYTIKYDCDGDALLYLVEQTGQACHTNNHSCFYRDLKNFKDVGDYKVFFRVIDTLKDRKKNPKEGSYTNYLFDKGVEKICKKIGEEATETVIAAIANQKKNTINEIADLYYHVAVLMENQGIELSDIAECLEEREGKPAKPKYSKKK